MKIDRGIVYVALAASAMAAAMIFCLIKSNLNTEETWKKYEAEARIACKEQWKLAGVESMYHERFGCMIRVQEGWIADDYYVRGNR